MRHPLAAVICLSLAAGCGDPPWTFPPDAGEDVPDGSVDAMRAPDAEPPPPPDAESPPPDAEPAPPDADPTLPVITSVATADGFHQIRQGDSATVVISGRNLAAATAVTFGALTATSVTPTDDGLRATLDVPHGHAPGALALTVVTPAGSPTFPAAITATPVVVSPSGSPTGRGTYESPWAFCDLQLGSALAGDTIELPAGELVCDRRIELSPGVRVVGAGIDATTIVGGFRGFHVVAWANDTGTTSLARFTVRGAADSVLYVEEDALNVVIESLGVDGGAGGAVAYGPQFPWFPNRVLRVDGLRYRGTGMPIYVTAMLSVTVANSELRGGSGCPRLSVDGGQIAVSGTTIAGCDVGIDVTEAWDVGEGTWRHITRLDVQGSVLRDNRIGLRQLGGSATLNRVDIVDDPATTAVSDTAIQLGDARLDVTGGRLEGSTHGIVALADDRIIGYEAAYRISLRDCRVRGGQIGVNLTSTNDDSSVGISGTTIEGGAIALRVADNNDVRLWAGGPSERGNNDLASAGFALVDTRNDWPWFEPQYMVGTRLNGTAYDDQPIEGPATRAPDYRITGGIPYQF